MVSAKSTHLPRIVVECGTCDVKAASERDVATSNEGTPVQKLLDLEPLEIFALL